jgi:hypothetical protein
MRASAEWSWRRPDLAFAGTVVGAAGLVVIVGLVVFLAMQRDDAALARLGGCPSQAFPLRPGTVLRQTSVITIGLTEPKTTGCWGRYDDGRSPADMYLWYTTIGHTPGWTIKYAYPQTTTIGFANEVDPALQVMIVMVGDMWTLADHANGRVDLSICACDPRSLDQ